MIDSSKSAAASAVLVGSFTIMFAISFAVLFSDKKRLRDPVFEILQFPTSAYLPCVILITLLVVATSLVGIFGRKKKCLRITVFVLFLGFVLLQIGLVGTVRFSLRFLPDYLTENLAMKMKSSERSDQKYWDLFQSTFWCCGVNGNGQWYTQTGTPKPMSCCFM